MNHLASTAVGCAVQATLVAAAGLAVAWLAGRRSTVVAASALVSAAATILVVTALAPAPRPAASWGNMWADHVRIAVMPEVASGGAAAKTAADAVGGGSLRGSAATVGEIVAAVRRLGAAAQRRAERTQAGPWFAVVLALGAAIGVARLAAALAYVRRVRRGSSPITCPVVLARFGEMAQMLGVRREIALHERHECGSPAVVGWRRPIVVLPADHRAWSDEQRRAALAHELAHIARGDVAWRLAASVVQAMHFFNPLVHWLVQRLALVQELAADEIAAAAVGGSANYLRAVSELALRLDDHWRLRAEPVVLPAFSSNLMRRIVMLQSMDGRRQFGWPRASGAAAAGLVLLVGLATTAVGGGAVADNRAAATPATAAAAMFQREALDPALIGRNGQGMFVARIGELMERPVFAEAARLAVTLLGQQWPALFPGQAAPEVDLSAIEYIAGTPSMTFRPKTGDDEDRRGLFRVGCEELVIRFNRDVAWQAWIRKYLPGSEAVTEDGFTYVKLPELPLMGVGRMMVAARDSRTLLILGDLDKLRSLVASGDPKSPDVASTWAKLDGGLFTVLVSNLDLNYGGVVGPYADAEKTPEEAAAFKAQIDLWQALADALKEVGAGFDLDGATNRTALRVRLTCADVKSAAALRLAIAAYLPILRANVSGPLETPGGPHLDESYRTLFEEQQRYLIELLDGCQVTTDAGADGIVQVCLKSSAPFVSHVVMATELADATAGDAGVAEEPTQR